MATQIFLGEPPANIKQWIIEHATPASHADTRFTLEGGTVKPENIIGTLDQTWMVNNGYYDDNEWVWIKIITQADIGNTVSSIGQDAFLGCSGLTSVTIPNSVTNIGQDSFFGCNGLTSVTIPDSVTSIGQSAFEECSNLSSITIPDIVTSIGEMVFTSSGLTSVTIVATGKPGADAEAVKSMLINAGVSENITWNMPG